MVLEIRNKYAQILKVRRQAARQRMIKYKFILSDGNLNYADITEYAKYCSNAFYSQLYKININNNDVFNSLANMKCKNIDVFCTLIIYYIIYDFKLPLMFIDMATNNEIFEIYIKAFIKQLSYKFESLNNSITKILI